MPTQTWTKSDLSQHSAEIEVAAAELENASPGDIVR